MTRAWAAVAALATGCAWTASGGGRVETIVGGPTYAEAMLGVAGGFGGDAEHDVTGELAVGFVGSAGADVDTGTATATQQFTAELMVTGKPLGMRGGLVAGWREVFAAETQVAGEVALEIGPVVRLASIERDNGAAGLFLSLSGVVGGDFGSDAPTGLVLGVRLTISYVSVDRWRL